MSILIIGQGLAGTLLAHALIERGVQVQIIDDDHATAASLVDVAVINPVTGRRYAKSWNIDELLPLAAESYTALGQQLNNSYLSRVSILQALPDARIEEVWLVRAADPEFQHYLDPNIQSLQHPGLNPFQYGVIKEACHLYVTAFIGDSRKWFEQHGLLKKEHFDIQYLSFDDKEVTYHGSTFTDVVLCTGNQIAREKQFGFLEVYPMKGEYLICRIPGLNLQQHLKASISIIPLGEKDLYWCGATYDRYDDDPLPTDTGREELMNRLKEVVQKEIIVEEHRVGIRLTTRDRRPYVGTHPVHEHLHVIAGLGTKGASLAPFCAAVMADHILEGEPIPSEVDISRHKK